MGENWNYKKAIEKNQSKMSVFSLPTKPKTFGQEYEFPDDISNILSQDLGKWLFKLAAWKGYVLKLLSMAEMEFSILDDTCDVTVARRLSSLAKEGNKATKDIALGSEIMDSEQFKALKVSLIEKKGEVASLRRLVELYTMQLETVSRDISRRGQDIKLAQIGIT